MPGQFLAVIVSGQRVEQPDRHRHRPAVAQHPFEVGHARLAAVPADDVGMIAIIDRHRPDADVIGWRSDRFQEGCAEWQQVAPVSGGSFGENGQGLMMLQRPCDLLHLPVRMPTGGAVDVEGAVLVGDPAKQGRRLELRLGYERGPGPAAEQEDVEPARVIGNDQRMRFQPRSLDPRADAGDQSRVTQES